MSLAGRAVLAAALLAGAATAGFSAMPKDDLAAFDQVIGNKLVSIDGSTILITPSERQLTLEVAAANGTAQKTLFNFLTGKIGTVSSPNDPDRVTGTFRITDAGIEIQNADGS